nr:hypothetical protein [Tanacetum cinerariifolium]
MNHIRMKDFNDFISRSFQVLRLKLSDSSSFAKPVHKCGNVTSEAAVFDGLGAAEPLDGLSWLVDEGGGGGGGTWADPEASGAPEALEGPAGGGGGGG